LQIKIMMLKNNQNKVDTIIQTFWKHGYMTLSRKYGKYLPEPSKIGDYDVDAIGKQKKSYVIGITLSQEDLNNIYIYEKLEFLASRQNRHSKQKVKLFIAVPTILLNQAKMIISELKDEARKNIKLVPINDQNIN